MTMTMNEFLHLLATLVPALLAGVLLGLFFFAGLWWTVRRLASSQHVALWFVGSMLLRTGIVVLGFYFILGDNWQNLVTALFGFVIARTIVTRITRITDQSTALNAEAADEP
jgi:F1F0 ATPase subunit 2